MGYVFVLLAASLWGLIGPASRFAMRAGIDPVEISFWRAAFAAVLFGVHAAARREVRIARRDLASVAGFGAVGIALMYVAYFRAVQAGGAALAAVLLYTAPVWVAVMSAAFLRERLGARKLLAMGVALAGVAGIATSGGQGMRLSGPALAWGLTSGWAYALYYLFGKRFFARYHASTLFLYALPVGAACLLPLVRFHAKSPTAWAVLAFVAVVPTYGSYLLYSAGLQRIEATRAATVATFEPVVAAVAAYFVWGEKMGPVGYACAALVILGVALMVTGGTGDARPAIEGGAPEAGSS
jgi:DME family drug/metabolite transporter